MIIMWRTQENIKPRSEIQAYKMYLSQWLSPKSPSQIKKQGVFHDLCIEVLHYVTFEKPFNSADFGKHLHSKI